MDFLNNISPIEILLICWVAYLHFSFYKVNIHLADKIDKLENKVNK